MIRTSSCRRSRGDAEIDHHAADRGGIKDSGSHQETNGWGAAATGMVIHAKGSTGEGEPAECVIGNDNILFFYEKLEE